MRKHFIQRTPRQVRFVRRTAPNVITSVDWLHFGQDRGAHTGANAIATDEDIAVLNPPAGEMHPNAGSILLEALKVPTKVVMGWIDGIAQQPLQPIPGCENLWQVFFADHVPGAVERDAFINGDT